MAAAHAAPLHSADHAVEVHLVVAAHVEAVHSHTEEVLTAVVRSLMAEVHMVVAHSLTAVHVEAVRSLTVAGLMVAGLSLTVVDRMVEAALTDMGAWEAVVKFRAPAHAPQHSSYA